MAANIDSLIGEQLRRARLECGITMADSAAYVGRSRKTIERYELGDTHVPYEMLRVFAGLYEVTLAWLVDPKNAKRRRTSLAA